MADEKGDGNEDGTADDDDGTLLSGVMVPSWWW